MSVASIISTKHDFASELEEILDYNIASNKGMFLSREKDVSMAWNYYYSMFY